MPTTIDPGSNLPTLHLAEVGEYGDSHAVSLKIDNRLHSTLWTHPGGEHRIVSTAYTVEAGAVYAQTVRANGPDKFVDIQFTNPLVGTKLTVEVAAFLTPAAARELRDALNALDLSDVEEPVTV